MHGLHYLLIGSLALISADAHGKCAFVPIVARPLTAANTAIGPGGGVVVGLTYGEREANGPGNNVEQPGWRFKQGGKLTVPTIKVLAPSLAVYEFTGDGATLVDDKQKALVAVRRGKELAALPTPTLRSAESNVEEEKARWRSASRLTLELAVAPPAGVVGVIVYVGKTPVNWAAVAPKTVIVPLDAGGHCSNDLPGTSLPTTGEISVAWFDNTGRVSTPSAAIKIKIKKT